MNKKIILLIFLFIFLHRANYCRADERIPITDKDFYFEMKHTVPDKNYSEKFQYKKDGNGDILRCLEVSQLIEGKTVTLKTAWIGFDKTKENDRLIKVLNFNNYLELPGNISASVKKPKNNTVTTFILSYKANGKSINKTVKINNIDRLVKLNNRNAIKLKMVMSLVESLEYETYQLDKVFKENKN